MGKSLGAILEAIPDAIKNIHLQVSLKGWPAAVSVIAICGATVAICAINATQPREDVTE